MADKKTKKGMWFLFLGEVFLLISTFAILTVAYEPLAFLALFALLGFIFTLVGTIKLRNTNKNFSLAFFLTIVGIILSLGENIFNNIESLSVGVSVCKVLESLCSIFVTYFIICGCSVLVHGAKKKEFSSKTLYVYTISLVLQAIYSILNPFLNGSDLGNVILLVIAIVIAVYSVYAYILYMVLLRKTLKSCK